MFYDDDQPSSWLCPTPSDRARFLDMQERLGQARLLTIASAGVVCVSLVGEVRWELMVLAAAMVAIVIAGGRGLERRPRPELWVFFSTVLNIQVALTLGAAMTGGPRSPLVLVLALPVVMVATRFSNRGLVIGAPVSLVLTLVATLGVDPAYVQAHPQSLAIPFVTILATASYLGPLVASDMRHRTSSTLDSLTGLMNRRAIAGRFAEVAQQAVPAGRPVSVVLADIDHFKLVNDRHGHATGDAVLRGVADALRARLRTFELLYRLGGEEFLLLLPGAGEEAASSVAETLRAAVADACPVGIDVTCSFGVATGRGGGIDHKRLLALADGALYDAKRRGRNRVCAAGAPGRPATLTV